MKFYSFGQSVIAYTVAFFKQLAIADEQQAKNHATSPQAQRCTDGQMAS
jgi:hypothetical protein